MGADRVLTVDPDGAVAWIDVTWPGPGHQLTAATLASLARRLRAIASEHPVIAVAARPGTCVDDHAFCADPAADLAAWFADGALPLLSAIRELDAVTVAVLDGYVSGIALSVALACDARVASATATFGVGTASFTGLGALLREAGGRAALSALVVGDGDWSAQEALGCGLVSRVLGADGFRERARRLARAVAARAEDGPLTAKRLLRLPADVPFRDAVDYELNLALAATEPPAMAPVAVLPVDGTAAEQA